MDWLNHNQIFLNCEKKRELRGPYNNEMRLIFQRALLDKSSSIVSYATDVKIMEKGCHAFVACLVDLNLKITELAISIVSKFPDVFPEELHGIPPPREAEFTIDVAPSV